MNAPSLRFDRFELQPRERRLLDAGRPVAMGARAFDVLLTLAGRAGHLVTKAELLDQVWPGVVVEENNLAVQVNALRKVLGGEIIATIPGRGYRFTAVPQILLGREPELRQPVAPPPAPVTSVPIGPRLFGRDADLARIASELAQPGCVTLVGPAGVGKTRLAKTIAGRWPGRFVWVDLAALANHGEILAAFGRSLDVQMPDADPGAVLARALGGDRVLVVLDNAEHVVDAIASLVGLLAQVAAHAHVLVTSQLPLAVEGERVARLDPLALPAATSSDAQALQEGAVALLVDRIAAADHRFKAGPETLALLREICSRLDGLPLALEMAGARVPLLGLQGVRDALNQRFALLTTGLRLAPGRHKTLHAALDWSHGLLGEDEQRLYRTLGVFAGGFTLDLVVAVAADTEADRWSIIDRLGVLVDRSLVAISADDPPRYHLLESMRAYAVEKLDTLGETQAARRRHVHAMLDLYARAEKVPYVEGAQLRAQALAEVDNVREAMTWALRHEPATAMALASAVGAVATFMVWRIEAQSWLAACEPLVDESIALATRAQWANEYSRQLTMSRHPRALALARRSRDLAREINDDHGLFRAVSVLLRAIQEPGRELDESCVEMQALLDRHPEWPPRAPLVAAGSFAFAAYVRGDYAALLVHRLAELELAQRAGFTDQADAAESNVIAALDVLGRKDEAIARSTALIQRIGDSGSGNAVYALMSHIGMLVAAGKLDVARAELPRAMQLAKKFDLPLLTDWFVLLAARQGRVRAAAKLIGHAQEAYAAHSSAPEAEARAARAEAEALCRARLDETTFRALVEAGRCLDETAVERLVLSEVDDD